MDQAPRWEKSHVKVAAGTVMSKSLSLSPYLDQAKPESEHC